MENNWNMFFIDSEHVGMGENALPHPKKTTYFSIKWGGGSNGRNTHHCPFTQRTCAGSNFQLLDDLPISNIECVMHVFPQSMQLHHAFLKVMYVYEFWCLLDLHPHLQATCAMQFLRVIKMRIPFNTSWGY